MASDQKNREVDSSKLPFDEALEKTGFGLYSFLVIALTGISVISYVSILYSNTVIVPASVCELGTTPGQQGLLIAIPGTGTIVGSLLWGFLADTRGRKSMLMVSFISGAVFNSIASISVNWIMLMVFQFTASLLASGQYTIALTMLSESVPTSRRNMVLLLVTSIFMLSQGVMAVLAIPIIPLSFSYYLSALDIYWNSWRTVSLVYCVPSLICAFWLIFMQDSPKHVFAKGREEEALEILRTIYRINNRMSKEEFQVKGLLQDESKNTDTKETSTFREQIVPLFKAPLLKYTVIMSTLNIFLQIRSFTLWTPMIANQVVEVLNTGEGYDLKLCDVIAASQDIPPDPDATPCALNVIALLVVLATTVVQSIANGLMTLVVNSVGRRNMVMIISAVCGGAGIIINLIPNAIASSILYVVFLLGILVIGLHTAITVALFPTHLRALALSVTMTGGRILNFGGVQLLNYLFINNCELGFYLFASLFAASALIALFLPDDRKLPKPAAALEEYQPRTHGNLASPSTAPTVKSVV